MKKPSVKLVVRSEQEVERELTLLTGKPYTNAAKTNIVETFKRFGWRPPSEYKFNKPTV